MRVIEEIYVTLDKPRRLLLTVGGLKAAERELNKSRNLQPRKAIFRIMMEELPRAEEGDVGMDFCEAILWAAMLHEDPDLTLDQVGNLPWVMRDILPLVIRLITETYLKIDNNQAEETVVEPEKKNLTKLNGTVSSGVSPDSNSA